ncbi:CYTH domain-containing protein [Lysinibacillus endophyticus]|uniref:CYTH domain-containing protein n=1 Tax=Ureibacillus endophyticus TaxID=1978490 RepID=UPI00209CF36C|nr:CYTH domain-containing protein [Lysinibacillus endophyticus]MCP1143820.1 CYTH domain-containing protein [Lysinibacillus endophyticus]
MSQELEIEFKNTLTKEQYENLLISFQIPNEKIIRQTNHYFDTPNFSLKELSSGLRIRETSNKIVCTLKEKKSTNIHLETTDELTREQADLMLAGEAFLAPRVKEKLLELNIPIEKLRVFGTLTTDRVEIAYKGGILVFDHSFYLQCDDYEVEYETSNENKGKVIFLEFLQQHSITRQVADKKIARFMKALKG